MEEVEDAHESVLQRIRNLDISGMFSASSTKTNDKTANTSSHVQQYENIEKENENENDGEDETSQHSGRQYDVDFMYELKRAKARKARIQNGDVGESLLDLSDFDDENNEDVDDFDLQQQKQQQQQNAKSRHKYDEVYDEQDDQQYQHRQSSQEEEEEEDESYDDPPSPTGSFATAHSRLTRRSSKCPDHPPNDLDYDIDALSDVDTIAEYDDSPRTCRSYRSTAWQTAYESADDLSQASSSFSPGATSQYAPPLPVSPNAHDEGADDAMHRSGSMDVDNLIFNNNESNSAVGSRTNGRGASRGSSIATSTPPRSNRQRHLLAADSGNTTGRCSRSIARRMYMSDGEEEEEGSVGDLSIGSGISGPALSEYAENEYSIGYPTRSSAADLKSVTRGDEYFEESEYAEKQYSTSTQSRNESNWSKKKKKEKSTRRGDVSEDDGGSGSDDSAAVSQYAPLRKLVNVDTSENRTDANEYAFTSPRSFNDNREDEEEEQGRRGVQNKTTRAKKVVYSSSENEDNDVDVDDDDVVSFASASDLIARASERVARDNAASLEKKKNNKSNNNNMGNGKSRVKHSDHNTDRHLESNHVDDDGSETESETISQLAGRFEDEVSSTHSNESNEEAYVDSNSSSSSADSEFEVDSDESYSDSSGSSRGVNDELTSRPPRTLRSTRNSVLQTHEHIASPSVHSPGKFSSRDPNNASPRHSHEANSERLSGSGNAKRNISVSKRTGPASVKKTKKKEKKKEKMKSLIASGDEDEYNAMCAALSAKLNVGSPVQSVDGQPFTITSMSSTRTLKSTYSHDSRKLSSVVDDRKSTTRSVQGNEKTPSTTKSTYSRGSRTSGSVCDKASVNRSVKHNRESLQEQDTTTLSTKSVVSHRSSIRSKEADSLSGPSARTNHGARDEDRDKRSSVGRGSVPSSAAVNRQSIDDPSEDRSSGDVVQKKTNSLRTPQRERSIKTTKNDKKEKNTKKKSTRVVEPVKSKKNRTAQTGSSTVKKPAAPVRKLRPMRTSKAMPIILGDSDDDDDDKKEENDEEDDDESEDSSETVVNPRRMKLASKHKSGDDIVRRDHTSNKRIHGDKEVLGDIGNRGDGASETMKTPVMPSISSPSSSSRYRTPAVSARRRNFISDTSLSNDGEEEDENNNNLVLHPDEKGNYGGYGSLNRGDEEQEQLVGDQRRRAEVAGSSEKKEVSHIREKKRDTSKSRNKLLAYGNDDTHGGEEENIFGSNPTTKERAKTVRRRLKDEGQAKAMRRVNQWSSHATATTEYSDDDGSEMEFDRVPLQQILSEDDEELCAVVKDQEKRREKEEEEAIEKQEQDVEYEQEQQGEEEKQQQEVEYAEKEEEEEEEMDSSSEIESGSESEEEEEEYCPSSCYSSSGSESDDIEHLSDNNKNNYRSPRRGQLSRASETSNSRRKATQQRTVSNLGKYDDDADDSFAFVASSEEEEEEENIMMQQRREAHRIVSEKESASITEEPARKSRLQAGEGAHVPSFSALKAPSTFAGAGATKPKSNKKSFTASLGNNVKAEGSKSSSSSSLGNRPIWNNHTHLKRPNGYGATSAINIGIHAINLVDSDSSEEEQDVFAIDLDLTHDDCSSDSKDSDDDLIRGLNLLELRNTGTSKKPVHTSIARRKPSKLRLSKPGNTSTGNDSVSRLNIMTNDNVKASTPGRRRPISPAVVDVVRRRDKTPGTETKKIKAPSRSLVHSRVEALANVTTPKKRRGSGSSGNGGTPGCGSTAVGSAGSMLTPGGGTPVKTVNFRKEREKLVRKLHKLFNEKVFDGGLPPLIQGDAPPPGTNSLHVQWNKKLRTTAGVTHCRQSIRSTATHAHSTAMPQREGSIELSEKVLDCEERVAKTFLHECCHVAAWVVDATCRPPHGEAFKKWARRASRVFPQWHVTTTHSYAVHHKFRWECQDCGAVEKRHSKSVGVDTRCKRCRGALDFLGGFDRDGTPQKTKPATPVTGFAAFTKTHYAGARSKGGSHGNAMKELSVMWKMKKKNTVTRNTSETLSGEEVEEEEEMSGPRRLLSRLV